MNLEIRPYEPRDHADVIAGCADLQEVERAFTDTRKLGSEIAEAYIDGLLADVAEKSGAVFVAHDDGVFAGFVACWIELEENVAETDDSTTCGYIADAYVTHEYRGKGVFQMLNAKAEAYLATFPEVKRIRINVLAQNARAIHAYRTAEYTDYEIMLEKKIK